MGPHSYNYAWAKRAKIVGYSELHKETLSHNFSMLETQYQTEAERLSRTLFFNSLNRFNLLELVAWVFAGLMIARFVFFLISLM